MSHRKNGFRILGLAFSVALSAMALFAAVADAAKWLVLGTEISKNHTFTALSTGAVSVSIPNLNIEITCSHASASGTLLSTGSKDAGHGQISFNGCNLFSIEPLELHETCNVEILPASAIILVISADEILLSGTPLTAKHFTNRGEEECNLEPTYNVTGTIRALITSNNTKAPIIDASVSQVNDGVKFGTHTATINGKLVGTLTTAGDVGQAWGVC